jgi:hypothetical protein
MSLCFRLLRIEIQAVEFNTIFYPAAPILSKIKSILVKRWIFGRFFGFRGEQLTAPLFEGGDSALHIERDYRTALKTALEKSLVVACPP